MDVDSADIVHCTRLYEVQSGAYFGGGGGSKFQTPPFGSIFFLGGGGACLLVREVGQVVQEDTPTLCLGN